MVVEGSSLEGFVKYARIAHWWDVGLHEYRGYAIRLRYEPHSHLCWNLQVNRAFFVPYGGDIFANLTLFCLGPVSQHAAVLMDIGLWFGKTIACIMVIVSCVHDLCPSADEVFAHTLWVVQIACIHPFGAVWMRLRAGNDHG